jgi:hypothetical protein
MSQPLIVSIPHRLDRQEAMRRPDSGISRLRTELAGLVSMLDYSWEANTLNFSASAMWQTITGRIEVLDDVERIEIDLPWLMRLLGDTVTNQVRDRGIALLEKPPGEAEGGKATCIPPQRLAARTMAESAALFRPTRWPARPAPRRPAAP